MSDVTPLRRQYLRVKQQHPNAILFFRLGDFYETFEEDARIAARELEITLTGREMGKGQRVPMAGIPYHALDSYLAKLIARGYKVALCEQLTEPGRGLVERDVVRVVTPGTVVEPAMLEQKSNNYLCAVVVEGEQAGVAYADITTGEFAATQLPVAQLAAELDRLHPAEVLTPFGGEPPQTSAIVTPLPAPAFEPDAAQERLLRQFQVASLDSFGCQGLPLAVCAAGAILHYLEETQKGALSQLTGLATYSTGQYMLLDAQTRHNLDVFPEGPDKSGHSLLHVLDLTRTAMGGRLLKRWLGQPLLDLAQLNARLDAVAWLHAHSLERAQAASILGPLADLERLVNRIRSRQVGMVSPRELLALRRTLEAIPRLREALAPADAARGVGTERVLGSEPPPLSNSLPPGERGVPLSLDGRGQGEGEVHTAAPAAGPGQPLAPLLALLRPHTELAELVEKAIVDDPPPTATEGGLIREGFSPELDELRSSSRGARDYLANLESVERERTGIRSLKVGYNKVFGYYIEVTNAHLERVPAHYIRKQTLVGAERFYTPELKEYESLVLTAQERMSDLEASLFRQVCAQVGAAGAELLATASAIAQLDVLSALAEAAARYGYIRPELNEGDTLTIEVGRHPVVERSTSDPFVPNDVHLACRDAQLLVLTGPNMSGKSTYLRQVALMVLMAQVGSFVPARAASIGLVDRIFTRVGARDDLALGRSTFLVEMMETAAILNQATPRSLLVLDEIGRGTSTYDGISIARAVAEFIHNHPRLGARTVFATHYHELTELARYLPRVRNLQMAVSDEGGQVVFLRQVIPGGADRSYGIHVARLAGLPRPVVQRAEEILSELEASRDQSGPSRTRRRERPPQLPLFPPHHELLEELSRLELDALTPLEALTKLYELQARAKQP
ncbi:MAG: DNA mismatch repair protein MutS [Chloroflexi bacterium]|nr:DNA mismatch repair protein MutS [Chloroflexota bacterium]